MRKNSPKTGFTPNSQAAYIAFYKPYGVLSQFTSSDGSAKRTLTGFGFPPDVYTVGRLDYDSEGLILLSDDARLTKFLLSPEHGHRRTYLIQVERVPSPEALQLLENGVSVKGRLTAPCRAELLVSPPDLPCRPVPVRFRKSVPDAWIRLTITEGKNRQVRRMTAAIGHPTLRLFRESIGSLSVFDLKLEPGNWIRLSDKSLKLAFS